MKTRLNSAFGTRKRVRAAHRAGFTLVEVLIATTILGMAVSMTFVVYLAALKRAQHTEDALKGTAELRYATDVISQAVRSASQTPSVAGGGTQLFVPPKDLGYAIVNDTTWLDATHTIKGSKANQRMLKVSNFTLPAVVNSAWADNDRPAGALGVGDVASYFVGTADLETADLRDIFSVGDTITIPATAFGPQVTGVINSISNNTGDKTITLTNNLGVDVPDGTKISATSGRRLLFEVTTDGILRYYPDHRDRTRFTILARDITRTPLVTPTGSATTVPFAIPSGSTDFVVLNLQKIPAGTRIGRTLQGVSTNVYTRTDPTNP